MPVRPRRSRTPDVASCWGTGGRSLRTATVTASTGRRRPARPRRAGRPAARAARTARPVTTPLDERRRGRRSRRCRRGRRCARRAQVGLDVEVDLERLGPLLLLGQGAADARGAQARAARCGQPSTGGMVSATRDQLPPERAHLAVQHPLDERGGLRPARHQAGPHQVAGDEPRDPVAELLAVDQHLAPVGQQVVELGVQGAAAAARRPRWSANGTVQPRDAELVVVVQVVRRRDQRDHAR